MTPRILRRLLSALATSLALSATAVADPPELALPAPPPGPAPETCEPIARPSGPPIPLRQTFRDDFDDFDLYAGPWTPHFDHAPSGDWRSRTLTGNAEAQIYVDPRYRGSSDVALGLDPFHLADGVLSLVARRTPPGAARHLHGFGYVSGMLSTRASFLQRYGFFEIRARLPAGQGIWPAFWLLSPGQWPPEIDVLEHRGSEPAIHMHLHWSEHGHHRASGCEHPLSDTSTRFHAYGVLWLPDALTYYLDRIPVAWIRAKPGLDRPMYLLANLAVGGRWPGPPDASTPLSAAYEIDWIAAYAVVDGNGT
jgi:beta-glucanase (GH16 family)